MKLFLLGIRFYTVEPCSSIQDTLRCWIGMTFLMFKENCVLATVARV